MFSTSSTDGKLKLWDTDRMQTAASFSLGKVFCHSYSPVPGHSSIISAGCDSIVRLCDLRTGAAAQSLNGHKGNIYAVQWSPSCSFSLLTGGSDGSVRFWDIRRPGSLGSTSLLQNDSSSSFAIKDIVFLTSSLTAVLSSSSKSNLRIDVIDSDEKSTLSSLPKISSNQRLLQRIEYLSDSSKLQFIIPSKDSLHVYSYHDAITLETEIKTEFPPRSCKYNVELKVKII